MSEKVDRFIAAINAGCGLSNTEYWAPNYGFLVKREHIKDAAEALEYETTEGLDTEIFGSSLDGVCNLSGGTHLFPLSWLRPITKKDLPALKKRYRAYLERR